MTYFADLSTYPYAEPCSADSRSFNIGWLAADRDFPTGRPDPAFVARLWRFCRVAVQQTRGLHECEWCRRPESNIARRSEESLLLGSAEIRVVVPQGSMYAAPNLVYHYVVAHDYAPPALFVRAVLEAPCPPEQRYFELLSERGLAWAATSVPAEGSRAFRFVSTPEGVIKVDAS